MQNIRKYLFFGSISLSIFAVHSLSGAENRTRDRWVGSANASSVLCRPPNIRKYLRLDFSRIIKTQSSFCCSALSKQTRDRGGTAVAEHSRNNILRDRWVPFRWPLWLGGTWRRTSSFAPPDSGPSTQRQPCDRKRQVRLSPSQTKIETVLHFPSELWQAWSRLKI